MPQSPTTTPTLREALAPYLSIPKLRRLAAEHGRLLREALLTAEPPTEVLALLDALSALLRPLPREQISGPAEVAALLLVEMGYLPQEQLRVVCLNTKNHVQTIHTVYQGTINSSAIRVAEVLAEPIRRQSAAIIVAHNHPSGDPTPSPEDIAVTHQIHAAGQLLDIDLLDHLIIGQGRWVSLREQRLGFDR
jgi:DNA repair protein RadC